MKQKLLNKLWLRVGVLVAIMTTAFAGTAAADEVTTTYEFTSKSWEATCNGNTANWISGKNGNALTSGQGIQITTGVSGANGTSPIEFSNITQIIVRYCTNSKSGEGTIKVQVGSGTEQSFSVTKPSSGGTILKNAVFTYNAVESGYVKVTGQCTTNSIYIYSVAITTTSGGSSLAPSDLALTGAPVALNFDLYNNANPQTVNFTTSSIGAVTVSESEYVTTSVSGNTITVTPVKVTPSAQTITVSQEADETYAAGSATFTVSIADSKPTVETPTFSVEGGTYSSVQTVSINCATEGAIIYYTLDGSTPTTSSSIYSTALTVDETTTVKAIAVKEGMNNSAVASATYTINLPYSGPDYVRVNSLDYLADGAKVIIAARYTESQTTGYYAMSATTSGKPTGVLFGSTTSDNGEILPAKIVDSESAYYWIVNITANGYTFTNSNNETLGYSSGTNFATGGNNTEWAIVRATASNSAMVSDYEGFNITNINNSKRGIALNNSHNYGPYDKDANINNNSYNFYLDIFVQGATPSTDPSISANDVNIAYDATSGEIAYTLENATGNVSATVTTGSDWLTLGTITASVVPFTCTANPNTTTRTATVTLSFSGATDKVVTITQAAAPIVYATIPELFDAATSTETPAYVTFNNWVVSGVSTNGKNVFVTDNAGNGFVIYYTSDMSGTYSAGNILSGTAVSCTLKKYNGFAELLDVAATDLTITSGGTVTVADVAMADLTGVNTGAVITLSNLSYDGTNLSDGTNTIKPYNTLYSDMSLTSGKTYNITGVYQQYNNTKEILPRSAADIVEVSTPVETHILTIANPENVIITATYGEGEDAPVLQNGENGEVEEGTEVMIALTIASGYVLESLTIAGVGEGQTITPVPVPNAEGVYTFNMPAYNVTVSASVVEYVAPAGSDYVRITSLDQLVNGAKVIIAARYNTTNATAYSAMKSTTSGKPESVNFTSVAVDGNETIPTTISNNENDYYWIVNVTSEGYTFTNANNAKIGYKTGTDFQTNGNNTTWTIERSTSETSTMVGGYTGFVIKNSNTNTRAIAYNGEAYGAYATTNMTARGYNFYLDFFMVAPETESVTVSALKYSTYASDNALDFTGSSIKAFYATIDEGGSTLIFHEIVRVPANTGVLLYSANGAVTEDVLVCTGETDATEGNLFVRGTGARVSYTDTEYNYVLSKPQGDNLGFYKANNNTVATNRAYIQVPVELSGAKSFTINLDDDPTGISNIDINFNEGAIYSLAGQRLQKMQKGINIVNGKKILK